MRFINVLLKMIIILEVLIVATASLALLIYILGYSSQLTALFTFIWREGYIWFVVSAIMFVISIIAMLSDIYESSVFKNAVMMGALLLTILSVLIGAIQTTGITDKFIL